MFTVTHPTGNANVRAVLRTLQERHLLKTFFTTVGVQPNDKFIRVLPLKLRQEILRRSYDLPPKAIVRFPIREAVRLVASKLQIAGLVKSEPGWASVDAVWQALDAEVAKRLKDLQDSGLKGVYAYEGVALETFREASELGLRRVYELPIAFWETCNRLLSEEVERWPEWEPTMPPAVHDSAAKSERKTQELELADVVIVPSAFVFDSLPEWARLSKKCVIAPFGSPPQTPHTRRTDEKLSSQPLRVLFAGQMSQRKGLADLFAAIKLLDRKDVELVVMGSAIAPLDFYRNKGITFRYEPPRSHAQVLNLMSECDVFALPSLVEGRALVQQEAMVCGLPLLVTPNAGGDDLVEEGDTGFLIPIRSPEKLAEKIAWFADHRDELPRMRAAAQAKALTYTWDNYGDIIIEAIKFPREQE